jgi:hypothetical protein
MNDYGEGSDGNENKSKTQDGYVEFTISILAVPGFTNKKLKKY